MQGLNGQSFSRATFQIQQASLLVLVLTFSIFEKAKKTTFDIDIVSSFQFSVLHKHSVILLHGLNLKHPVFLELIDYTYFYFVFWVGYQWPMLIQKYRNALETDKLLHWNSFFPKTKGLIYHNKLSTKILILFEVLWLKNNRQFLPALKSRFWGRAKIVFNIVSISDSKSCFSRSTDFILSFRVSV